VVGDELFDSGDDLVRAQELGPVDVALVELDRLARVEQRDAAVGKLGLGLGRIDLVDPLLDLLDALGLCRHSGCALRIP
jgi:hypothetical protein